MKIFLSHAKNDASLARQLAAQLDREGFLTWIAEDQIAPGENWASKIGKALDESDLMVTLLTPSALKSESLRQDIEFALGSKKFEGRLFSVFVGPGLEAWRKIPWILLKLPHRQIDSASLLDDVVKDIQSFCADFNISHSNA